MSPQITRLDAAALRALGMDRVMVDALLNMVRVTGSATNGATVPEIGEQADNTEIIVTTLRDQLERFKVVIETLLFIPEPVAADLSGIDAQAQAPLATIPQQVEQLISEVRQIAEQLAVLSNQMQELKQGTTP